MTSIGPNHSLLGQLDSDETANTNPERSKDIQFARALYESGKLDPFKGFSIVIHKEKVIAAHTSSAIALRKGVKKAKTGSVYLLHVP